MRGKEKTIRLLFIRYYFYLVLGAVIIVGFCFTLFSVMGKSEMIGTAAYHTRQIERQYEAIQEADDVNGSVIPDACQYVVFDRNGKTVDGNIPDSEISVAWNAVLGNLHKEGDYHYITIQRKNEEICVLRYQSVSDFQLENREWTEFNPNHALIIAGSAAFGGLAFTLILKLSKVLSRKLRVLAGVLEQAAGEDLNVHLEHSQIREIDSVMNAAGRMCDIIKHSKQQQWEIEQARREQISALAHDIKTPLTVVGGNAELLEDTPLNEDQIQHVQFIEKCTEQIGDYIRQLIDVSKSQNQYTLQKEILEAEDFLDQLREDAQGLCMAKELELVFETEHELGYVDCDMERLLRACMNIVSNGADYTPVHGKLFISAKSRGEELEICITDSGRGFSEKALKSAVEKFFTEEREYFGTAHYGMGMYIANHIVIYHGGYLTLQNSDKTGGAMVTIHLPRILEDDIS